MTIDRPRGGRRPEDFPAVRDRDARILECLREFGPSSRNDLAAYAQLDHAPRLVTYALHRLRYHGLVVRIPHGNEGHGLWAVADREEGNEGS